MKSTFQMLFKSILKGRREYLLLVSILTFHIQYSHYSFSEQKTMSSRLVVLLIVLKVLNLICFVKYVR